MTGNTSFGSATNLTKDTREENRDEITIPERTTVNMDTFLFEAPDTINTSPIASRPLKSALACMYRISNPSRIANAAPKDAPLEAPNVSGVARGFANSD